jgi:two-component system, OmpR family, sensor histidine kinase RstB
MRRLYLQIYLTIIAILVIVVIAVAAIWRITAASRFDHAIETVSEFADTDLPPAGAPRAALQRAVSSLHMRLSVDVALYAPDGTLLASAGRPIPPARRERPAVGWVPGPGGPSWQLRLDDGRSLIVRLPRAPLRPGVWLITVLGALAAAVAIGAWPIARRMTRRLERLKSGVEQLGHGDLTARVPVEGRDEVAALAASFNGAAARIEELIKSHKMLLANCSHELRTPLTRINLALALVEDSIDPARREQIRKDIAELDQLIDEILLASRLDAVRSPERVEDVELLALAAEEAARYDAAVEGEIAVARGDPSLLRRMIRNLLENARRYGGAAAPDVRVGRLPNRRAWIEVRDRGPGISESEREKIFEPFHRLPGAAETGRGSGLGLALVRQIARNHGGEAVCLAAEGGGSRFRVELPVVG